MARISLFFAPGVIFPASRKGYDSDYFYLSSQSYTFTKFDCSSKYSEVIIMYLLFFAFTLFSIRLTLKTKIVNLFKKGSMRDDNLPLQKISMHLFIRISSIMEFFPINSALIVWNLGEKKKSKELFCNSKLFPKIYTKVWLLLKVSKFQNEFMKSSFLLNYEPKIVKISAL